MRKMCAQVVCSIMVAAMVIGCAGQQVKKAEQPCSPLMKRAIHIQKTDNFLVVLDTSETMSAKHKDEIKLKIAKNLVTSMSQCIPDIKLTSGLRTFGRGYYLFSIFQTDLIYGMKPYAKADLAASLKKADLAIGNTPMAKALKASAEDIQGLAGKTAIIIFSDGRPTDEGTLEAAESLKKQYGDKLCIYTVQIGDDPEGKKNLDAIAKAGGCGFATTGDKIAACEGMAEFVEKVFFDKKCPDSDGDDVCDDKDECPGTPKGAKVDARGCWVIGDVLFDFDKYEIKTQAYSILDDAVTVLKNNPDVNIEIQGHTDGKGTAAYNLKLSDRRAASVKQYFGKKGISSDRLSTRGFGLTKPVAGNDTAEGRAKNRRVEFKVK